MIKDLLDYVKKAYENKQESQKDRLPMILEDLKAIYRKYNMSPEELGHVLMVQTISYLASLRMLGMSDASIAEILKNINDCVFTEIEGSEEIKEKVKKMMAES